MVGWEMEVAEVGGGMHGDEDGELGDGSWWIGWWLSVRGRRATPSSSSAKRAH